MSVSPTESVVKFYSFIQSLMCCISVPWHTDSCMSQAALGTRESIYTFQLQRNTKLLTLNQVLVYHWHNLKIPVCQKHT